MLSCGNDLLTHGNKIKKLEENRSMHPFLSLVVVGCIDIR